jgi:ACR3 family arsenite efflux pump ArsB
VGNRIWAILIWLKANLVWSIPVAMLLGLAFGAAVNPAFLKPFILPLTFVMVYPMMVNLQVKKVLSGQDYKLQATVLLINFAIVPFVAFAIGQLFLDNVFAALGLLLAATLPTSGMTISWTGFAKGNLDAAVKTAVIGLILGSLVSPLYAEWLMGAVIAIPMDKISQQIAIIVFLPLILGYATQRFIIHKHGQARYFRDFKPRFPLFSTLGLLGIAFFRHGAKGRHDSFAAESIASALCPPYPLLCVHLRVRDSIRTLLLWQRRRHCPHLWCGSQESVHCPGHLHERFWPGGSRHRADHRPRLRNPASNLGLVQQVRGEMLW